MTASDGQLLQRYAQEGAEAAFSELVSRHIDLVFSAALRVVNGDTHLAQDVTQTVFLHLARRARSLPRDVVLAGWLHRHTCFAAASAVRSERRRKTREQNAMEFAALDDNAEPPWEEMAPYLDESLNHLRSSERGALVLRFLKGQDFRTIGLTLGISEDAAQKRVSRAVESLRAAFSRRGFVWSTAGLTSVLTAKAVTAAPAGLAAGVAAASLSAVQEAGAVSALLNLMCAKINVGIISSLVLASVIAPLAVYHHAQAKLLDATEILKRQADERIRLEAENERLSNLLAHGQSSPMPDERFPEVLRLRGEVGRLRTGVEELTRPQTTQPRSREEVLASMREMYAERVDKLKQLFAANPGETVPQFGHLTDNDWLEAVRYDHHRIDPENRRALSSLRSHAQIKFGMSILSDALRQYGKINDGRLPRDLSQLAPYFKSPVDDAVLRNWAILPTSGLPAGMRIEEDWVVTQRAPVNAELDQRIVIGLKSLQLGQGGTNDWINP